MDKELEYGKWYPISVYYENQDKLDWALVQFKEIKSDFMGLPHIAELRNNKWYLESDDKEIHTKYINEDCEPVAFMLWQPNDTTKEANKELKIELFNIYDIIVFEDENGITQDCVCSIEKDKEVYDIVGINHDISIYKNGSYKVYERNGKGMPYFVTNKKIIHLYTLKNDNRFYEIYPTDDYGVIDADEPMHELSNAELLDKIKKQDIILNVINEKNVDILDVKIFENYKHYCRAMEGSGLRKDWWLTEEEFNTLKEWSKCSENIKKKK